MKTWFFCAALSLALVLSAAADDQLRNVQTQLKGQGFYYGNVNGQPSTETTSAIRRYQIRNGLEVTGTLTTETLAALGLKSGESKSAVASQPDKGNAQGPVNIRRDESVEESDRNFLRREESKNPRPANSVAPDPNPNPNPDPAPAPPAPAAVPPPREASTVPPPAPLDAPSADYPVLFAGTPYANAPVPVQQQTLRRAQSILANRGFYEDIVDGLPGPATEEALLTFQRAQRLTLTGRLDLDTLNELRLLPGRPYPGVPPNPGVQFGFEFRLPHHVFRGVWVDHP